MLFDDKKMVSVIVDKRRKNTYESLKKQNEKKASQKVRQNDNVGYEQAAYEMIEAASKKDALKFAQSLKNFIRMCEMMEDD